MENKINVAELLKDCPNGMELDCTNYDGIVKFDGFNKNNPYNIRISVMYDGEVAIHSLTIYGQTNVSSYNKCVIFPKGKTTWEGFHAPFKDGDIVALDTEIGVQLFIFKEYADAEEDYVHCYMMLDDDGTVDLECGDFYVERFATEEEKQKLFDAIKAKGCRWNAETKTLETLVEPTTHEIVSDALATFGAEHQRIMCMEECAELIDALAKYDRGRADAKDVITELADVSIMVEQMAIFFGKEEFETEKERKLKRLLERINEKS